MSFLCLFILRSVRLDANIFCTQAIICIAFNQLHLTANLIISYGFGCPEFRLRFQAIIKISTHLFTDKSALDKAFLLGCIHIFFFKFQNALLHKVEIRGKINVVW
jgi:hypothetical protein